MAVITEKTPPLILDAPVIQTLRICRDHVVIECVAPHFPDVAAGQFAQLLCRGARDRGPSTFNWTVAAFPRLSGPDWSDSPAYLRRPFSIADAWRDPAGDMHLVFISRTIGPGTAWLERLKADDTLNLTGPLGRGFRIPGDDAHNDDAPILLVGGGVGIPPLLLMARQLAAAGRTRVTAIFGATSADLFPVPLIAPPDRTGLATRCLELPGGAAYPAIVTTDDDTLGLRGRVTDALQRWSDTSAEAGRAAHVMACGPEAMLSAIARQTRALNMSCQLCIERQMGCGLGTCLSCVVRVRDPARPAGWRWALSCTEGPVFERDRLLDNE